LVVFAFAAHVAYPSRKIWDGDKFFTKPGEMGDMPDVHIASRAFIAWQ
jgi:hypothetical protein